MGLLNRYMREILNCPPDVMTCPIDWNVIGSGFDSWFRLNFILVILKVIKPFINNVFKKMI